MGKYITKAIQADFGIFEHIAACSDRSRDIQSDIIRHIQNPVQAWHIQNPGKFRTRGIFRTLVYSEPWHVQNQRHIQDPDIFRTQTYLES